MSLAARNVLITGSHALGLSIARLLAEEAARVILHCGARDGDATGNDADSMEVLSDPLDTVEQAEALVAKCWESFGPLAGLVVVPEEASPAQFADSDDDWQAAMRSALKIPFFLTRAVAARMEKAGGGVVVHVVGAEPRETPQPLAVNEVTRSASITMTLALAKAFPAKVRICAVVGSAAATRDTASGVGSAIARTVLFLLSEESLGSGVVVRLDANG